MIELLYVRVLIMIKVFEVIRVAPLFYIFGRYDVCVPRGRVGKVWVLFRDVPFDIQHKTVTVTKIKRIHKNRHLHFISVKEATPNASGANGV